MLYSAGSEGSRRGILKPIEKSRARARSRTIDDMEIDATFSLKLGDEVYVTERALAANLEAHAAALRARKDHDGILVLSAPGQAEQRIEDELRALVPNLCFDAIPRLLDRKAVSVAYFSYPGAFDLVPVDSVIRLSGDFLSATSYRRDDLLVALFECGCRFIRLLQRLHGEAWQYPIEALLREAAPARLALEQAGLKPSIGLGEDA